MSPFAIKTFLYTSFALFAFAGNSVLCRLALGEEAIDAASFTVIRMLSGIIVLIILLKMTNPDSALPSKGSWSAAVMLFLYAITFSFAYISLDTGTGALILFGAVQITMILRNLMSGNKMHYAEWIGLLMAFSGLVYLFMPTLTAPSLLGFILMAVAGIAWGFYTLAGKGSQHPFRDTVHNFLRTLPFVIILIVVTFQFAHLSPTGIVLAMISGGITSGLGYAVWYAALGGLSTTQAAVVQLLVPVIAAIGGVVFSNELISMHLVLSFVLVLGGILMVLLGKHVVVHK